MTQTLSNIYNNVNFALQLQADAITRLQEQAATGSRVNRPSDAPSDAYRILELNSQQNRLGNFIDRLSEVSETLEYSSTVVNDVMSQVTQARTYLTQIINGIYGERERDIAADQIDDILEQVVLLANTRRMGQYIFGGGDTATQPFAVERTNGRITAVTYQGSLEERTVEVAPGAQSNAYYIGQEVFGSDSRGTPVFAGDTGAAAGTGTSSVRGDVWLTVTHDGSNYRLSIDDGATYVTVPSGGDPNQAVVDSRTDRVLYVDSTGINSTGVELVRVPGTYNLFDTLISIRDALRNERGLSEDQIEQVRSEGLKSLEELNQHLAQMQVSIGSEIGYLEKLRDSLKEIKYDSEDEMSRLQDADVAQVAVDLTRQEVLYQMSLAVAAKIMSVSLLDFIR